MSSFSGLHRPPHQSAILIGHGSGPDPGGVAEAYAAGMSDRTRAARVEDVHRLALAMPQVTVTGGTKDNPVYQVGGKSFVFFRNPRPDAVDPDSGERLRRHRVLGCGRGREAGVGPRRVDTVLLHEPLRRAFVGARAGQPLR